MHRTLGGRRTTIHPPEKSYFIRIGGGHTLGLLFSVCVVLVAVVVGPVAEMTT